MGEAKRRRAIDPRHGKPWRGLVVSPPIESSGNRLLMKSGALDPQELRSNLLFWDRLDFPEQNIIHIGLDNDAQFLEEAGVLQRSKVLFSGSGDMAEIYRNLHVEAFRRLDQEKPGRWSLATGERSISFGDHALQQGRGALVRLYGAIPVPDKDVPLADILEFRLRRSDELLALRTHLESVYQRVISAGDGELAWNTEVEALQRAIQDHIKTSRETSFRLRLADISASLNLLPIGASAITAYSTGLPMVPSLVAGAMLGISLDVGAALKRHRASPTPFQYVTSYHQEVF
ncbi:DUF6236 family protein [Ancylobacter polymorphus]|uniref:DUF6236 family protein n=1 Tax=Ancylobacter polymorphus TaxID=223390 RepID=A0A9E6ZY39_9HYPH|nr:DUF6236 family protein [Ancylobacter polymorphus]UOK72496.1 DUF6236 family protein [Ancylobacter polymorphus]